MQNKKVRGFSAAAIKCMETYAWPGNIRELENKIQRAVILSEKSLIEPQDLGFDVSPISPGDENLEVRTLKEAKDKLEKEMATFALDKHAGNIAKAADELGVSRPTLYDIMKKHGLFNGILRQDNMNPDRLVGGDD